MSRRRKFIFAALALLLFLGGGEAALRLAGFSYQPVPERIWLGRLKGGIPSGEVIFDRLVPGLFSRDALLFWKPVAGKAPFNRAGLRDDAEIPAVKPANEFRVLVLGDSCTFLGEPRPWPELLEDRLPPTARVLNAAVPAWSSLQGRRYLESRGLALQPDVVAIYFGWNDHWRSTVKPDAEFDLPREKVVALQRWLSRARLYQGLHALLKGSGPAGPDEPPGEVGNLEMQAAAQPFRVPLVDFEDNLRQMAVQAREAGATPVFITAPTQLHAGAVPEYLVLHGFVARAGEPVEQIHERYAAAVRRVARQTGSGLVDAAAAFARLPDGGRRLMRQDGIHLTAVGLEHLAQLVAAELTDLAAGADAVTPGPARPAAAPVGG